MRETDRPCAACGLGQTLPFLTLASVFMTIVEAALRRGGTIEVYAIKE